jgi:hypothetical protein
MELGPDVIDTIYHALESEHTRYESDTSQRPYVADLEKAWKEFEMFLETIKDKVSENAG